MQYKLLADARHGIMVDPTPILRDIRDTFEVSFLLPDGYGYIALFTTAAGIEYKKAIKDGICKVPAELLKKEQDAELTVIQMDGEKISRTWTCGPLKIRSFYMARKSMIEVTAGITTEDLFNRLVQHEERMGQLETENAELRTLVDEKIKKIVL